MFRDVRSRFWLEAAAGAVCGVLAVVTLFSREWIELVFGVDPDRGSGALEWAVVLAMFIVTAMSSVAAHREWARAAG